MKKENLDLKPIEWHGATFWYNQSKQIFELYGYPYSDYTYRLFFAVGVWVLEAVGLNGQTILLSGKSMFNSWNGEELFALAAVLHSEHIDVGKVFSGEIKSSHKLYGSRALLWAEDLPVSILNLFESKKSSE